MMAAASWLHARANLKGLHLEAGVIPPAREGEALRVPLVLTVKEGRVPRGIEITAPGVQNPLFIDQLNLQQPTRTSSLKIPTSGTGSAHSLTGRWRAACIRWASSPRHASSRSSRRAMLLPMPAGDLPLPAMEQGPSSGENEVAHDIRAVLAQAMTSQACASGSRAIRCGRWTGRPTPAASPLTIKQWAGAAGGTVWLTLGRPRFAGL